ncbi:MAG: tetratricopeptide repeat protein [Salinisphaeraceae bacterium]
MRNLFSLLAAGLAAGLAACAMQAPPGSHPSVDADAAKAPDASVELQYHVLAGEWAVQRGERRAAAENYVEALRYSDDPALAERATRIAVFADAPELAYRAAQAWAQRSPDDGNAYKTAARLALTQGDEARLDRYVQRLMAADAEQPGAALRGLVEVLSGEPAQADLALSTMAEQVAEHDDLAEAHYARALLALRYERLEAARQSAMRALALRSDWSEAVMLHAGVLVRQGDVDAARAQIDRLDGTSGERAEYRIAFARMLVDSDQNAAAADAFEWALEIDPDDVDARFGLGVLALTLEEWQRAEQAFEQLYEAGNRADDAAYYRASAAESQDDYTEARRWYQRVAGGSHAFDAKLRAARMLYLAGDLAAARAELRSLRRDNPDLAERLFLAEGELLYEARRFDDALAMYDRALTQHPGDTDLLYGRSLALERLGRIDEAAADLRRSLAEEPDDPRALNALGYLLTNHTDRHQEALGYIERALEAEPDDAAIIDSMGWVQYRLGNLEKARDYLERAHERFPDPEVAAHLGEVLWRLGKRDRAREVWQEALSEAPDHPVLNETIERLTP